MSFYRFLLFALLALIRTEHVTPTLTSAVAAESIFATQSDIRVLELNAPVEREISGGQTHVYTISISKGDFSHIVLYQRGVNISSTLIGPDGRKVVEADIPGSRYEPEWISHISESGGDYRVEVLGEHASQSPGTYKIILTERRRATVQDQGRVSAAVALLEAGRLSVENEPESNLKAVEKFKEALTLYTQAGRQNEQAAILNCLGRTYTSIYDYDRGIEFHKQALAAYRSLNDRYGEASTLNSIGIVYYRISQHPSSIEYYSQALAIRREVKDLLGQAGTLNNLALSYEGLSRFEKAIEHYEQSLRVCRELKYRSAEGRILKNLGVAYSALGRHKKSIEYYERALAILREVKDRVGEASTLNSLGNSYDSLGQYDSAIQHYEQALAIRREVGDRYGESVTLHGLGMVHSARGRHTQAIEQYEQALAISREVNDRSGEGRTLVGLGASAEVLGRYEKAGTCYEQALVINREVKDRAGEASTLGYLMGFWSRQNSPRLAILYGKQAINIYQEIRGNIKKLDTESQQSYLQSNEDTYRKLADILISQGRLAEAEKVLELLKEEEFNRVIRRHGPTDPKVGLTRAEAEAEKVTDQLAALAGERGALLTKIEKKTATDQDRKRLDIIEAEITEANRSIRRVLAEVSKSTPGDGAMTRQSQAMMQSLRRLGTGVVALYTVVARDKGWVILTTPDFRRAYPIDAAELNQTISDFRLTLRSDRYDPLPLAKKLYSLLFLQKNDQGATLAADLKSYRARTLMWSLDGVLRYVPVGALHDGSSYLLERYTNLVFTSASLTRLLDPTESQWRGLGLGVSREHQNFEALPSVPRELKSIIREEGAAANGGVLPGVIRLDERFTRKAFIEGLREGYPIVHIASHFRFNPEREETSFLLLGDGSHFSLEEMQDLPGIFERVELLTLSACDTATVGSNGKEMEGLAFVAQDLGAKAVVASLWPVADEGTEVLMREFYRLKRGNPSWSKAAALRQAQTALLKGRLTSTGPILDQRRGPAVNERERGMRTYKRQTSASFAHPHYWAPFILIGNWK